VRPAPTITRGRGFTLLEIVIAVAITGVLFVIGYAGINQALRDRDALAAAQLRLTNLQRALRIVSQDFAQIAPRPARDVQGGGNLQPALLANRANNILVTFTRSGWANPTGAQRQSQQRVRYVLDNGSLVREHWLSVDTALNSEPRRRVLLEKVKSVTLRFMDPQSRTWRDDWPPLGASGAAAPGQQASLFLRPRPAAIELVIDLEDWGTLSRLFEIAT
jgi:general secretion pathway protein J